MSGPEREAEDAGEATEEPERSAAPAGAGVLRIAGSPPRVVRLSRKALASIGVVAGLGVGGALIYALQSPGHAPSENLYDTENSNRAEQVTSAPASYADGDGDGDGAGAASSGDPGGASANGQPDGSISPTGSEGSAPPPDPRAIAAEQARARKLAEQESARTSRLFLAGETAGKHDPVTPPPPLTPGAELAAIAPTAPPTPTAKRQSFLEARSGRAAESDARILEPASPYLLQAGSVIAAALITGIRSDLPGQITAQVTQNIYDSPTGQILLVPQGSRLIGEYDSEIDAGQTRALLAWDRLILPGGRSIQLDRMPGTDAAGKSGLQDRTDYHWGSIFKAALISTLLGASTELVTADDSDLVRALRHGTQDTVSQTGRQLVERQLSVPPTLTVRPGFTLQVIVTRDLVFEPQGGAQ